MADGKVVIDTELDSSGIEKGIQSLNGLAKGGLKVAAASVAAVGTSLLGMAGYAIKAGSSFEAGMSQVEAISGASTQQVKTDSGEIVNGLQAITDKAKEMGNTSKFSATESSEALSYMSMAGWEAQDMYDGLAGIMNLAAASGESLASTSDIVTDAMTAFGLSADQSGHFADVLAKASSSANTNVGLLGESFKYVAPVAGAMGYDVEDVSIALGLMANSGIKASQAGTALRTLMTNMAKPTKTSAMAMEKLGLTLDDGKGKMKSFADIMYDLREGFSNLQIPQEEFIDRLSELDAALESGEIKQKDYDASLSDLMNAAYGAEGALMAEAAASLAGKEGMSGLLAIVNASEDDFNKLSESIYNCDGAAEQMAATMQDNLQGDLTILQSNLEALGIAVYEKLQEPLREAATKGQEYITQLTSAFETGGFEGLAENIGTVFADILSTIAAYAPQVAAMAVTVIGGFAKGIIDNAPQMLQTGMEVLQNLGTGISQALPNLIPLALQTLVSFASGFISNIPKIIDIGVQIIGGLVEGVVNSIPTLVSEVPKIINDFWDAFDKGAIKLISAGLSLITKLAKGIIDNRGLILDNAGEIAKAIFNTVMHLDLLNAGKTLIKNLASGVKSMASHIGTSASSIGEKIFATIKGFNWANLGQTVINLLRGGVSGAAQLVVAAFKAMGTSAVTVFRSINWASLGKTVLKLLIDGAKSMGSALASALKSLGKAGLEAFKAIDWASVGKAVINGILSGVSSMAGSLLSKMKSIAGDALQAAKDKLGIHSPSKKFAEVGKFMIDGIVQGLKSNTNTAKKAATDLSQKIYTAAKTKLDTYKAVNELSLKDEATYWKLVIKQTKAGTQARLNAEKQYATALKKAKDEQKKAKEKAAKEAKEVDEKILQAAENNLKIRQRLNKISEAEEAAYWEEVRKQLKKGTASYQEATIKIVEARRKLKEDVKKIDDQYKSDVKSVKESLKSDIQAVVDAYDKAVADRQKAIMSQMKLTDEFEAGEAISKQQLIHNLQSQVKAYEEWDKTLSSLGQKKGLAESGLLEELQAMGVESIGTLKEINEMSDTELKEYILMYEKKKEIALNRSKEEHEALKAESEANIAALVEQANKDLKKLEKQYKKDLKALGVTAADSSQDIGQNIVKSLIKGIKSQDSEFQRELRKFFKSIETTAKDTLQIHSPSRIMRKNIGPMVPAGVALGVEDNADVATAAVESMAGDMTSAAENAMSGFETNWMPSDAEFSRYFDTLKSTINSVGLDAPVVTRGVVSVQGDDQTGKAEQFWKNFQKYMGGMFSMSPDELRGIMRDAFESGIQGLSVEMDGKETGKVIAKWVDQYLPQPT